MNNLEVRAWSKERNKMFYQDKDFKDLSLVNGIYKPVLNNFIKNNFNWYKEDFELMQWTGLRDCKQTEEYPNGQKIFDGDFLGKESHWSIRIEYEKGCFMVRDLDKVQYNNLCLNIPMCNFDFTGWKVIGNKYDNPELLESGEK